MRKTLPPFAALKAFEAVVRLSSFKHAAAELNVSPSAVSHQIKRLEDELNCKLMHRDRNGIELTPAGERYAAATSRAFQRIAAATEELLSDAGECLTLQSYSTFAIRWLLPRLAAYENETGQKPIRLVTSQKDADFSSDPVDACIMIGHPTNSKVSYTRLFTSRVFPVASPDYLAAHGTLDGPNDLRGHSLLQVYPSADDWPVWLSAHGVNGLSTAGEGRFDSYDLALNAAARGMGVALAIEPFANEDLDAGRLVELFPGRRTALPRDWYFAVPLMRRELPKVDRFARWLSAKVAADPSLTPSV